MITSKITFKIIFLWVIAFIVLFNLAPSYCLDVPVLKGHVNDYADILSHSSEQQIEVFLSGLEQSDSTQIVVLTIPSLEGEDLEEFSIRVVDEWKIGQKGLDNGAMLLIAKNDRKLRIEVGYGLEGSLTDLMSGQIIRNIITPQFKSGNFEKGVIDGVHAMAQVVRGEFNADDAKPLTPRTSSRRTDFSFLIVLVFLINMVGRLRKPLGALAGGVFFPIMGAMLFNPGLMVLLALIPIGIIAGLFLSLFGGPLTFGASHARGSSRGGGHWLGGFSGGGGGFGGFSGGGGGFGGGGSSGGW
ncbi:MAG: TPM domain-containing protein [Deltaproteobacteria bacterium]|nr:TPM domain-containing protein [Deltaproteobacteria bacterium]